MHLVFEVTQDTWHSNKANPSVSWSSSLSCPLMASDCANFVSHSDLTLISSWMLTMPWKFYPISFSRRPSRFAVFQTEVAHLCFCLVRIKCHCSHTWNCLFASDNRSRHWVFTRARERHINFEHINFLKIGTTLGQPAGYHRETFIFTVFRGEHINFLAWLTLGQPAICPRAIWTLTRAKCLCLCAYFLPDLQSFFSQNTAASLNDIFSAPRVRSDLVRLLLLSV